MRKIRLLVLFSLIVISLLAFTGCDKLTELKQPDGPKIEMTTLTLTWREVKGARLYTIEITPEGGEPREMISSKNSYSLVSLTEGKYSLRVKANGKDEESHDSPWSVAIPFEREREPGMVFTLNPDGKSYELVSKGTATGDIVIPNTYRTLPITSIGKTAFFNKSDVTSVTFGENITSIGDFAFGNCSYITELTLPEGLTHIGENAFASCRMLSGEIVIPGSVKNISKSAFAYCGNVDNFVISAGVESIDKLAFTSCASLTSITLPDTVKHVGEHAFSLCAAVSGITLGEGVEWIDSYAFSGLGALTGVRIPNSVTTISEGAFYQCPKLTNIQLGTGVRELGMGAFTETGIWTVPSSENEVYVGKWFVGLRDITAPAIQFREDTYGIASFALYQNQSITQLVLPNSVQLVGMAAFAASNINTAILGFGVKEIGEQAFVGCKNLSKVVLGSFDSDTAGIEFSSLEILGDSVFQKCPLLTEIEMPESLKVVGSHVFRESGIYANANGVVYADNWIVDFNDKLTADVTVLEGTVGLSKYAFYGCSALNSITLPESVKTVGRGAFYDCASLFSVKLPDTLRVIEDYTFYRCKSLKLFTLPPTLEYIGRSAFYKCASTNLQKDSDTEYDTLSIPASVTYIGDYAFYGCGYRENARPEEESYYNYYGPDTLRINGALEYLGAYAFWGFCSLRRVELGGTTAIGERAFYKCESLAEVDFGTALVTIGNRAFYKCEKLTAVHLPQTVTTIGTHAFYRCTALSDLTLGSVETIGDYAFFGNSSLTSLSLPVTLTTIGQQAFRNCKKLTDVILHAGITSVAQHAFYGNSSLTLYMESATVPAAFHAMWNSSYRPVITDCVLSEDLSYVISFKKSDIKNVSSVSTVSDPSREGYTFFGWGSSATATEAAYTSSTVSTAENGTRLYALWLEEQE